MTADRARKKQVRGRMARTGESYTAALRHIRSARGDDVPDTDTTTRGATAPTPADADAGTTVAATLRLAVAQTTPRSDPADAAGIRATGEEVRALQRAARAEGADLVHFTEATLCFPDKRLLSRSSQEITESDWGLFAWDALEEQLLSIRDLARELRLRTVLGAQTWRDGAQRPRSSLLVIGPDGTLEAQYDERRLSRTKETFMYERGREQVTIDVGDIRLGLASGLEVLFGDVFLAYEDAGVDAVLLSCQAGPDEEAGYGLVISALAAARQHGLSISYAVPTTSAGYQGSGIIGPDGKWAATCTGEGPALAVHDLTRRAEGGPRDWRRSMVDAD